MHNAVMKLIAFIRSFFKFLKIVIMFTVLLLILHWIQNLTGKFWGWMGFIRPFFDFLLDIGNRFMSGSINLFAAVFEFKFLAAFLIIGAFYYVDHLLYLFTFFIEETYLKARRMVHKYEEDRLNSDLENTIISEQKKIKKYRIYISALVKPKFAHREYNVNLEEQNQILIKHLIQKTGVSPLKYGEGFIFNFDSFEQIDRNLDIFGKLFESKAPINFIVCVQILGNNTKKEEEQLKTLIDLKIINKISAFADTVYRYSFNRDQGYETSQLGLFQKEKGTFEIHQFIRKN